MDQSQKTGIQLFLLKAAVMLCNTGIFALCWYLYYTKHLYLRFAGNGNYMVIGMFLALNVVFANFYGGFQLTTSRSGGLAYSHGIALGMTYFFMYIVTWLLVRSSVPNVWPMLLALAGGVAVSALWSWGAYRLTNKLVPPRRTLIIYDNGEAYKSGQKIAQKYRNRFEIIGTVVAGGCAEEIEAEIEQQQAEAIMLCGLPSSLRNDLTKYCIAHGILAYVRPNIGDLLMGSAKMFHMNNLPVYLCQRTSPSAFYLFFKRAADILLGSAALVVTSPIMLVTAIAIKAYDGGPVLFTQKRMTKDRKVFLIHKFRSMKVDADKGGKGIVTLQNDDRITPVGKIIRACRVDELPQLVDIVRGYMTIVGPRPERIETIELYEKQTPEFALRLQVKAGLTGYAQVYGKANTSPYDKLQMDLMYIGQQSFLMDLRIVLKTITILFVPESTEGFETEMDESILDKTDNSKQIILQSRTNYAENELVQESYAR